MKKINFLSLLLATLLSFNAANAVHLETLFGDFDVDEPLLQDLLACPALERLKSVHHYGICEYTLRKTGFTRYTHTIGVFVLTRKFGGSLLEQAAAIGHDLTHSAFSHLASYVHDEAQKSAEGASKDAYQDNNHITLLKNLGVDKVVTAHNFELEDINHKNPAFTILDCELPDLCTDRLEYNLDCGYVDGLLTKEDVREILEHVYYENGKWFLDDVKAAVKLSKVSLYHSENIWGGAENMLVNDLAATAIRQAVRSGLITYDEFHQGTDDAIWQKLKNSTDPELQKHMERLVNRKNYYKLSDMGTYVLYGKFRGIDPLVKRENGLVRLTSLDAEYAKEFNRVKDVMHKGWHFEVLPVPSEDIEESCQEENLQPASVELVLDPVPAL